MRYCFVCNECGAEAVKVWPVSKAKCRPNCSECGKRMERDFSAEFGRPRGLRSGCHSWPMASDAAGVAPDQVPEAIAEAKRNGVPTDFTKDGRPIFTGPGHRKKYCEAHGLYDRNGGYGDPRRLGRVEVGNGDD